MKKTSRMGAVDSVNPGGATKPSSSSFYDLLGHEAARYVWCQQYVANMKVLDVGCGYGFGADFLAATAKTVAGADVDPDAISFARSQYTRPNLKFFLITGISQLAGADFDIVIALEVIEHLADPQSFINDVCRVLRPTGQFLLSTPNRLFWEDLYVNGKPRNPHHLCEFYPEAIENLLKRSFKQVERYAQVWPGDLKSEILNSEDRSSFISKSKVPRLIRLLAPRGLKESYLQWKGIPPGVDNRGKWRDYPVVPCVSINKAYPHQAYRCMNKISSN